METEKLKLSSNWENNVKSILPDELKINPPNDSNLWDLYFVKFNDPKEGILVGKHSEWVCISNMYGTILSCVPEKDAWTMYREIKNGRWHVVRNIGKAKSDIPDGFLYITEQLWDNSLFDGSYNECYDFLKTNNSIACWRIPKMEDLRPSLTLRQVLSAWLKNKIVEVKEYFKDTSTDELKSTDWHVLKEGAEVHQDDPLYQYRIKESEKSKTASQRISETEEYIRSCKDGTALDPNTFEIVGHPIDVDEAKVWKELATDFAITLDMAIDKIRNKEEV